MAVLYRRWVEWLDRSRLGSEVHDCRRISLLTPAGTRPPLMRKGRGYRGVLVGFEDLAPSFLTEKSEGLVFSEGAASGYDYWVLGNIRKRACFARRAQTLLIMIRIWFITTIIPLYYHVAANFERGRNVFQPAPRHILTTTCARLIVDMIPERMFFVPSKQSWK